MAKRKKRKASAPASQSPAPEKQTPRPVRIREADPAAWKSGRGTCLAGMFFVLLIGLFLGSLIPGLLDKGPGEAQAPSPPPVDAPDWRGALPAPMRQKLAQLESECREKPGDAAAWTSLGNLYFDIGHPGEAVDAYNHALHISPDNPDVLSDLGILYRELGQPEQALESFRRAAELDPGHQNSIFNQGVVLYFDLDRRSEAMEKWRTLLKMNPEAVAPDGKKLADMLKRLAAEPGPVGHE